MQNTTEKGGAASAPRYELDGQTVSLEDFILVNNDGFTDLETAARLWQLQPGEEMRFGGGAAPLTVLRRVA